VALAAGGLWGHSLRKRPEPKPPLPLKTQLVTMQTGEKVAIKKIHIQDSKQVCCCGCMLCVPVKLMSPSYDWRACPCMWTT
jgi:hypothetical protein